MSLCAVGIATRAIPQAPISESRVKGLFQAIAFGAPAQCETAPWTRNRFIASSEMFRCAGASAAADISDPLSSLNLLVNNN
jgi:hypothetical protein